MKPIPPHGTQRPLWSLRALNFFMADVQAGIGPFLGIFLLSRGWQSGPIGTVMTIGGVAGMLMIAPAGAIIDIVPDKRRFVTIPCLCIMFAWSLVLISDSFWMVTLSQVAIAVAGAAIGPAVIAITLGIARQAGFNRENGYNQAFNHAGNVVGAALSGYLGMRWGMTAIFLLSSLFGVLVVLSTWAIPARSIDNQAARGSGKAKEGEDTLAVTVLAGRKPLLILALALACFHLGNAALLPLYGMAAAAGSKQNASAFVAMTVIIAQLVMVGASLVGMKMVDKRGYWLVIFISFISLPIRGFIAANMGSDFGIYPVQILDGIGAGLQSVAVPGLVAHLLNGTGRINAGQGAVMTIQGIGAALSPAVGGWIAQSMGYDMAFVILGSFSFVSVGLWLAYFKTVSPECNPVVQ